jgi:DNA-binding transcriptional MerR regulator/effector-binding domain-containing protein
MPRPLFSIGEFSRITGLTVKTLRFYHEEGLLTPVLVDRQTGYRYYEHGQIETARLIGFLRGLEFPVADIREILASQTEDEHVLELIQRHKEQLEEKVRRYRKAARSLEHFLESERNVRQMATQPPYAVDEKDLPGMLIAAVRMKGKYSDCGKGFSALGGRFGRYINGKPFLLHHDAEYKEDDADFEACFPVRDGAPPTNGVTVRQLSGGRCVSLLHKGPYEQLGSSYAIILRYIKDKGYQPLLPSREVYLKGPGMIFRGNPRNYLTEIQIPIGPK